MSTSSLSRPISFRTARQQLIDEVQRIDRLDASNQKRTERPGISAALQAQARKELHLASEGLFMRLFRNWERFLETSFLLAVRESELQDGTVPRSYLKARSKLHVLNVLELERERLSWSDASKVLKRVELLLKDGRPHLAPLEAGRSDLVSMQRIRNRIAHESDEAHTQYLKVVKSHFTVLPAHGISPGRFLNLRKPGKKVHYLKYYCDLTRDLSFLICGCVDP